jgi:hypothetical protein
MTGHIPGQFTVRITNLADGGQLTCSNDIDVNYTQPPSVGDSTVALTIDVPEATINPPSYPVSDTAGTLSFNVTFPNGTILSGKNVIATITNNGTVRATDPRTNISILCPQIVPPIPPVPPAPPVPPVLS